MTLLSAQIEEFEQGTWVAELVSLESFAGSFQLFDGSTWTGTKVTERAEHGRYHTTVVGGAGMLGASVPDKYYSGNVALSSALQDLCSATGETFGSATAGVFLSTYQRQAGILSEALDGIADAFSQIWWFDRGGLLNMAQARPVGAEATGKRESSDADGSAVLVNPENLTLGASYASDESGAAMQPVRHIRWSQTPQRFSAQIYPMPFLFRAPTQTKYDKFYEAVVQSDNGDGTVDVVADSNRFGVTKVRLFCGVPGSKVKTKAGEIVTLFFLGGNPQKPACVAMQQNTAATKQVARKGDSVDAGSILVVAPAGTAGGPCTITYVAAGGVPVPGTTDLSGGQITSGSPRLVVDDG